MLVADVGIPDSCIGKVLDLSRREAFPLCFSMPMVHIWEPRIYSDRNDISHTHTSWTSHRSVNCPSNSDGEVHLASVCNTFHLLPP